MFLRKVWLIYLKKLFIFILFFVILTTGCTDGSTTKNDKYIDEISWAESSALKVAVEIDEYDGDILSSGIYYFEERSVNEDPKYTPYIYDIFIAKEDFNNSEDLTTEYLITMIGGYGDVEVPHEITLEKGDYLYIVPSDPMGIPTGYLKITKK